VRLFCSDRDLRVWQTYKRFPREPGRAYRLHWKTTGRGTRTTGLPKVRAEPAPTAAGVCEKKKSSYQVVSESREIEDEEKGAGSLRTFIVLLTDGELAPRDPSYREGRFLNVDVYSRNIE